MSIVQPDEGRPEPGGKPETAEAALNAVQDAIQHWLNLLEEDELVTGWVLHYATARYAADGDPIYSVSYACGPQTDMVRAVGTSDLGHRALVEACAAGADED